MWNYGHGQLGGGHEDNSNTQFAILGLREAAIAGVRIRRRTWELTSEHFIETQNEDGGWGYHVSDPNSTGSMTCSGIGCLVICDQMLGSSGDDLNADGTPKCCNQAPRSNRALRRGVQWLSRYFAVGVNPGHGTTWVLYYLYGVERAGRLSGQRFFGQHDWYREGASLAARRANAATTEAGTPRSRRLKPIRSSRPASPCCSCRRAWRPS